MVAPVYEVICDCCAEGEYIGEVLNKSELADELTARGYIVLGNCKTVFCSEECASNGAS